MHTQSERERERKEIMHYKIEKNDSDDNDD